MVPTHEARQNILKTAKAQKMKMNPEHVKVAAHFLTEDTDRITESQQVKALTKYDRILMDEIFQFKTADLEKIYHAKLRKGKDDEGDHKLQLIGAGAYDQVPAPDDNGYDLKNNDFFNKQMFEERVELDYLKGNGKDIKGRFEDDSDEIHVQMQETGRIPEELQHQKASDSHDYHLTLTKRLRDEKIRMCSYRYCERLSDDEKLEYKDAEGKKHIYGDTKLREPQGLGEAQAEDHQQAAIHDSSHQRRAATLHHPEAVRRAVLQVRG
jgi:hypothetical protein